MSCALGIAAKTYGLSLAEIVLMSALVYAGPAQFATLEPLASGKPALQIILTTLLINLRLLVMSAAMAPYFRGVKRAARLLSIHFLGISSFIVPYLHFQKHIERLPQSEAVAEISLENLSYYLGVALTNYSVWVLGTGLGYWVALRFPSGFEEGLKFMLPGYFAALLFSELKQRTARITVVASFFAAIPGALWNPDWGWLATALMAATVFWGMEQWMRRG